MVMNDLKTLRQLNFKKVQKKQKTIWSILRSTRGGKITPIPIEPAEPKAETQNNKQIRYNSLFFKYILNIL